MKLIANFKQNGNLNGLSDWFSSFVSELGDVGSIAGHLEIILLPSLHLLVPFKNLIDGSSLSLVIKVGVQNVSRFKNGAHTGEVGAGQLEGLAEYALLGHSERMSEGETTVNVVEKVTRTLDSSIKPIVCFGDLDDFSKYSEYKQKVEFVYEPPNAISTYSGSDKRNAADLAELESVFEQIGLNGIIYGGSVNDENIVDYLGVKYLKGFLVGSACLNPNKFARIARILCSGNR